mmetsp:Transcript_10234/g.30404  ORF Transcript_10234/g.30404 Transcript_10234/m.30404 type:complete len:375 (+) Transcript_10234:140-1264(+)
MFSMFEPVCREHDDPGASVAGSIEKPGDDSRECTNAVSKLQEFIQSCSSSAPHKKILTWTFDEDTDVGLQFRATVSFVFNNVPHHFCGGWQPSKKKSQRDTAERVRRYLSRGLRDSPAAHAGDDIFQLRTGTPATPPSALAAGRGGTGSVGADTLADAVADELWMAMQGAARKEELVSWELKESNSAGAGQGGWCATATLPIMGVPHHFLGGWCSTAEGALRDAAERILWYFGRLTDGGFFMTDASVASACAGTGPPLQLCGGSGAGSRGDGSSQVDGDDADGKQSSEDKMILMQVHNALQRSLAKDTQPGERVWVMSYESDPKDLQIFRAIIKVPSWEQTFFGEWCRSKKAAQRSACLVLRDELSQKPPVPQA